MQKRSIPKNAAKQAKERDGGLLLPHSIAKIHGFGDANGKHGEAQTVAHVSLKYFCPTYQCLSKWTQDDLEALSGFVGKVNQRTWVQIYETAGSLGNKKGLGYTPHKDRNILPSSPAVASISEDITFFELRVTERARVHGFRSGPAFFLCFLDKDHAICPM